ncbi:MAG TPA: nucleoside triphosphate pyrophosphohydrolase [Longimicrobiaceae bacterium]|nr:nucleoside triphosphate pyrophosphohydrolase [Longimicrobiaceae bacterium]
MERSQAGSQPPRPTPEGVLDRSLALVEFLRARCPWDAAQTPVSLQPFLLEEAHEVVEAIASGDDAVLRDELGDLLLNFAFQVVLAEERGAFGREEVVAALEQKMHRRHPHLYGGGEAEPWEALKARERAAGGEEPGVLDGLSSGTDPLLRAYRIQERVAGVGFDWDEPRGAFEKVREEVEEVGEELGAADPVGLEEEMGDLLFAVVNLARLAGVHPTSALARANVKFARRFTGVERLARGRGLKLGQASLSELDELWEEVKREERERR